MAVDEQSSQDSTLIDDDLVAALGFEPVATFDAETSNGETANGDAHSNGEVSVVDDVSIVDDAPDVVADEVSFDDLSTNGDHDGFGIDEIGDSMPDALADAVPTDEIGEERGSFFDLDTATDDVEELALDEVSVDEVAIEDVAVEDLAVEDLVTDDVGSDGPEAAVEALEVSDDDDLDLDREAASDLASVPSIADPELDSDATAPVSLIDLDLDEDAADLGSTDLNSADLEDVETPAAIGDAAADAADVVDHDVIDLDTVDLSDDIPTEGFADVEVHELADADSVFADTPSADATPILDPPSFDDPIGHPATETVEVGSGLLDLDAGAPTVAEETVGTAAVATAATATATKGRRRLRARKSRRVIRHIDPWSVLTFSVLFHMVVFAALLLSSVLVWNAAIASGMVENVESFIQELGDYETFEINADVMFRAAIVIAGMLTLASSVLVVLLTVVFNLISDLVGGIRVTVIEEETVRVPIDKKRSKARNE